jgi:TolB-like protein
VTVAVLPFSNMNLYSTVQPAPAALSELLARQLRQTHPDKVVIRNAAGSPNRTFSRTKPEEAPLDFVVQGSVLVDAQHLRIVVQLVRLRDQNCIWAREFDRDSDDAETEADLAQQIAADMQQPLASLSAAPR